MKRETECKLLGFRCSLYFHAFGKWTSVDIKSKPILTNNLLAIQRKGQETQGFFLYE